MHGAQLLLRWLISLMMVAGATLAVAQDTAQDTAQNTAQNTAPARAPWHPGNFWGVGVQASLPHNDFADKFSSGYGLQGMFNYPLIPLIDLSGSVGWNHFPGADDGAGADIWEFAFGARLALGVFFMNGEVGYFSKVDETNFIPGLGLRFAHWEFAARTKAVGSNTWSGLRVGYYF